MNASCRAFSGRDFICRRPTSLPPPCTRALSRRVFSGRPFGSARPYGRYLVAPTPEGANKVATPAIDRIAFVFNLLLRIIGGDGFLSASRPLTKRAFF